MLPANCNQFPVSVSSSLMSRQDSFRQDHIQKIRENPKEGSNHSIHSKIKSVSQSDKQQQQPTAEIRFPWKLHRILDDAESKGYSDIVSWVPSENGFKVHKTKDFDEEIMPKYFDKTKYKSFQRQLNMWGFDRVGSGTFKGAYLHPYFIRGKPEQCHFMERTKIKGIYSKKLRKNNLDPLGGGSNHSYGSVSNHSVSNQSLGGGSDHNYLGGGSFHSHSPSMISSSSNSNAVSNNVHATLEAARKANVQKMADLERQKEEVQRKLAMVMTSSSSPSSRSRMVTPHGSLHSRNEQQESSNEDDDCFQPLPLDEGDSLLFSGRNFFFVEDGKSEERPWMDQQPQGKRAGRRYSLELKAPDSDEYVLRQLDNKYFGGDIGNNGSVGSNGINIGRINVAEEIMAPTPLPPNCNGETTDMTNHNCNSSLIIGLDKPKRRFSFLSTPVENPFEKPYPIKPLRKNSSMSHGSMNKLSDMNHNNMMTMKMKMKMHMMTNHLSNMNMKMNLNMNNSNNNNSFANLTNRTSLNNLLRMSSQNSFHSA
jgi:hypothetical protein